MEGLSGSNGHRQKVLGEGESVSCRGARTKGKGCECKLTKNMFLHSDMLNFFLNKNITSMSYSLTQLYLTIRKLGFRGNGVKI